MAASPRPRKRTVPKAPPAAPVQTPDFEPIRVVSRPAAEVEERIPLFYIDDEAYTIPRVIAPGVALEYLRVAGERGETAATPVLLQRLLGEDGYQALEESTSLTEEQLEDIVQLAVNIAFGKVERKSEGAGKGRGRR